MPDENILLQYVKSIDERTARMETALTQGMQKHQDDDKIAHGAMQRDIDSLKASRTWLRALLAGVTIGGTGGAAKMGFLDKMLTAFGGG